MLIPLPVLGASKKALLYPDISARWNSKILRTNSDVFCVTQHDVRLDHLFLSVQRGLIARQQLVYAGTRRGSILAFDRRLTDDNVTGQELLGDRFTKGSKSITHLSIMNEWQLLLSTIAGDVRPMLSYPEISKTRI